MHSIDIVDQLTMDIAILRGKNPNRTLFHLSGVHGKLLIRNNLAMKLVYFAIRLIEICSRCFILIF
jgi:hypothetical protein